MNKIDLSAFFTTKPQAVDFSARLSDISTKLYETDLELENLVQQYLGVRKKDNFFTLLRDIQIPLDSNSKINEFIKAIKETISVMPEATLTLAVDPDETTLKAITDWFLLNIGHQVLIDIRVNPEIIAGSEINYKGNHYKSTLKPLFQNNRQDLEQAATKAKEKETQNKADVRENTDKAIKENTNNSQNTPNSSTVGEPVETKPVQPQKTVQNEPDSNMNDEYQFRVI